jgi:hypothetical protein
MADGPVRLHCLKLNAYGRIWLTGGQSVPCGGVLDQGG